MSGKREYVGRVLIRMVTQTYMKILQDEFTNLKVSRQRKWQLRHPKKAVIISKRFMKSLKRGVYMREYMRKTCHFVKRYLSAKSYYDPTP